MSEIRTHEQVVGIVGTLAQEAFADADRELESYGPQTQQAIDWLTATDAALRLALAEAEQKLVNLRASYDAQVAELRGVSSSRARDATGRGGVMLASIEQPDHRYVMRENGQPRCGDFCDQCGDCLHCYADDECPHGGNHSWVIYLREDGAPFPSPRADGDGE